MLSRVKSLPYLGYSNLAALLPIGPQIVTLVLSCRVSEILELLYVESRFFDTPPLFRPKFQGVPLGVDPWCWGLRRAKTPSSTNGEIMISEEFQPM